MTTTNTAPRSRITDIPFPELFVPQVREINASTRQVHRSVVLLASAIGAVLAWAAFTSSDDDIVATGAIRANLMAPDDSSELPDFLSSMLEAPILEIRCNVGDEFQKGDVLVQLDVRKQTNRLEQTKQKIRTVELQVAGLIEAGKQETIAHSNQLNVVDSRFNEAKAEIDRKEKRLEIELRAATYELRIAKIHLDRIRKLKSSASLVELDLARVNYKRAQERLDSARIPVGRERLATIRHQRETIVEEFALSKIQREEEILYLKGQVKSLRFDIVEHRRQIELAEIRAPYDGVIVETQVTEGHWQQLGRIDIEIAPTGRPFLLIANVDSKEIGKVVTGQQVEFFPKSFGRTKDRPLTGHVIAIPLAASNSNNNTGDAQHYEVVVELDELPPERKSDHDRIKIGTAGQCVIKTSLAQSPLYWFLESVLQQIHESE